MYEERIIADRYRLVAPLGRGGHADVYEAVHVGSGMAVAVKLLRPARHDDPLIGQRFEREARAVQRLRHPNTVRALDSGQLADGARFLVLELVDGAPLSRLVDRGPLPVARAIHIARQILGSAGEAHAEGLVHRDLKPDNVLVSDHLGAPDHVKVVDFGVAHELDAASLTSGSALVGTPAWMAPEQWVSSEVDARTDLYAVGALIYYMVSGEPPFTGSGSTPAATSLALMEAHLHRPAPRLDERVPACPPELAELVARLLEKRPDDRPRDVAAVLAALARCVPVASVAERRRAWPVIVPLIAVAAVAFAVGRVVAPEPPAEITAVRVATTGAALDTLAGAVSQAPEVVIGAAPAPPVAVAAAGPIELLVRSEPPGASVTIAETGSVLVAETPAKVAIDAELEARVARGGVTLEFKRAGYARERRALDGGTLTAGALDVRLEPITPTRPGRELPSLRTP